MPSTPPSPTPSPKTRCVNDVRREFWGRAAITAWIAKEIVGDRVTMSVTEVIERGAETVVRAQRR